MEVLSTTLFCIFQADNAKINLSFIFQLPRIILKAANISRKQNVSGKNYSLNGVVEM